jgi:hypothetical protein
MPHPVPGRCDAHGQHQYGEGCFGCLLVEDYMLGLSCI